MTNWIVSTTVGQEVDALTEYIEKIINNEPRPFDLLDTTLGINSTALESLFSTKIVYYVGIDGQNYTIQNADILYVNHMASRNRTQVILVKALANILPSTYCIGMSQGLTCLRSSPHYIFSVMPPHSPLTVCAPVKYYSATDMIKYALSQLNGYTELKGVPTPILPPTPAPGPIPPPLPVPPPIVIPTTQLPIITMKDKLLEDILDRVNMLAQPAMRMSLPVPKQRRNFVDILNTFTFRRRTILTSTGLSISPPSIVSVAVPVSLNMAYNKIPCESSSLPNMIEHILETPSVNMSTTFNILIPRLVELFSSGVCVWADQNYLLQSITQPEIDLFNNWIYHTLTNWLSVLNVIINMKYKFDSLLFDITTNIYGAASIDRIEPKPLFHELGVNPTALLLSVVQNGLLNKAQSLPFTDGQAITIDKVLCYIIESTSALIPSLRGIGHYDIMPYDQVDDTIIIYCSLLLASIM